jgi:hypothetical protein
MAVELDSTGVGVTGMSVVQDCVGVGLRWTESKRSFRRPEGSEKEGWQKNGEAKRFKPWRTHLFARHLLPLAAVDSGFYLFGVRFFAEWSGRGHWDVEKSWNVF